MLIVTKKHTPPRRGDQHDEQERSSRRSNGTNPFNYPNNRSRNPTSRPNNHLSKPNRIDGNSRIIRTSVPSTSRTVWSSSLYGQLRTGFKPTEGAEQ